MIEKTHSKHELIKDRIKKWVSLPEEYKAQTIEFVQNKYKNMNTLSDASANVLYSYWHFKIRKQT